MSEQGGVENIVLKETALARWHVENSGSMVNFGGWSMPKLYGKEQGKVMEGPLIQEHLAGRGDAVRGDESHMGRVWISGEGAERFAQKVTTNNVARLRDGESQYTLISDHNGFALDDSYLMRVGNNQLILVVNAGNRIKDLEWLVENKKQFPSVNIDDRTETTSMMYVQGPRSVPVMRDIFGAENLPAKKNEFTIVNAFGTQVYITRTGYTGEAEGFEIIVDNKYALDVWGALGERDVKAIGLGARNSLRAEAGFILHGHELGVDPLGNPIPTLANNSAALGINFAKSKGDYNGRAALERQMTELEHVRRREYNELASIDNRALKRISLPIATDELDPSKPGRSLREGYRVWYDGQEVGVVTTGVFAPFHKFTEEGVYGVPSGEFGIRSIGLALMDIRSDLRYDPRKSIKLQISDAKRKMIPELESLLMERHMIQMSRYSRPVVGFKEPLPDPEADHSPLEGKITRHVRGLIKYARTQGEECLPMVPSVIKTTPLSAVASQLLRGEYNEHKNMFGVWVSDTEFYPLPDIQAGDPRYGNFISQIERRVTGEAIDFFGFPDAEVRGLSGQQMVSIATMATEKYINRGLRSSAQKRKLKVIVMDIMDGGHLSSQPMGVMGPHTERDELSDRVTLGYFPMKKDSPYELDVERSLDLVKRFKPDMMVFGGSNVIVAPPIREIMAGVHLMYGSDNPNRPVGWIDGAHLAAILKAMYGDLRNTLIDGVLLSTHKTVQGPDRGMIVWNTRNTALQDLGTYVRNAAFPGHTSSSHPGTLAALYLDLAELNAFSNQYPQQVIANAKAFAAAADRIGLQVEGPRDRGFTDTHIALLNWGYAMGNHYSRELQRNNILTNGQAIARDSGFASASGTRVGMPYMTKAGAKEHHMGDLAQLMKDVRDTKNVLEEVKRYRRDNNLLGVHYALSAEKAEPLAREVVETLMKPYKAR